MMLSQIAHGSACLTLAWEENLVCPAKFIGIIGKYRLNTQPVKCVDDRPNIASVIFYYCYTHVPFDSLLVEPFLWDFQEGYVL